MREKEKIMVTNEGRLDLGSFTWDDQVFTDILIRDNPINSDQALGISRFLRDEDFQDGAPDHHPFPH